jgi:hypothetical protein
MAQEQQKGVTKDRSKYRCPAALQKLIDTVNMVEASAEVLEENAFDSGDDENLLRGLCKSVHELAQMAALPADLWRDYAKAVVGTVEEWERFCRKLPASLWRRWPEIDTREANPFLRKWPRISIPLIIGPDYIVSAPERTYGTPLIGIDARRLRECRVCWRIFWATRIDKSGGPFGCSPRCNNTLRQREFKASKKP